MSVVLAPAMLRFFVLSFAASLISHSLAIKIPKRANVTDVLDYVNPLIGSQKGGNVFAGATLPYGMAKGESSCFVNRFLRRRKKRSSKLKNRHFESSDYSFPHRTLLIVG